LYAPETEFPWTEKVGHSFNSRDMSAIRKKKAQISSKLKHMIHKHPKADTAVPRPENSERLSPALAPVFTLSSNNLDATAKARENLRNFKLHLERNPSDPLEDLMSVIDNFSSALTSLRHRTADLQSKLAEAQAAAADLETQESQYSTRKRALAANLAVLRQEEALLLPESARLQREGERMRTDLARSKALKKAVAQKTDDLNSIGVLDSSMSTDFASQTARTGQLQSELNQLQLAFELHGQQVDADLAESQRQIRDLTIQAKQVEIEATQAKVRARNKKLVPVMLTPDVSAFVIDDRVRISDDDSETLRFMIGALQKENERLIEERDDTMMDMDCLMQENIGLKQIIRQLSESA
jgi:DNA repair exonuclease SbcCD ATPase subunit